MVNKCDNTECKLCGSTALTLVMDFGEVALAGGFLKPEDFPQEQLYRLRLCFCRECYLLQIVDVVPSEILFKNYFYFSSAIAMLRDHFADYATEVTSRFLTPENATVVEIGCNDGVLLKPLAEKNIQTLIGIDPATNIVESIDDAGINIVNDFFCEKVAEEILQEYGPAHLICANNVCAHSVDFKNITKGIYKLLDEDGVFVFEVHYLGKLIEEIQYDMIYHEHIYYYSILSLSNHFDRYDMEIFDIKPIPIHAGSMRYYVRKKGRLQTEEVSERAVNLFAEEKEKGYDREETFLNYAARISASKHQLMTLLDQFTGQGKSVAGYGASGRANTIIQYCGIDHRHLDYIIDDAPAKWGYYTPGEHFEIRSRQVLEEQAPDYLLIFAWSYLDTVTEHCRDFMSNGGSMIVPLPDVRVISHPDANSAL